ncbi:uncharacterized protein J7T54_004889 [Emericellopsis cladophorae]|uniref:Uncharacterized protein n=1 Tax=Emericellopsis cladophorae TaxID=2686198 RepID=A0A9Q0B7R0_9HYPO|nr:uncharacterized protein J7T54_004889 [Emericellopsis cladophorae]KAI6777647.1 hypothetical protein J7T54_004889 [Emericellopsis cladophorae]
MEDVILSQIIDLTLDKIISLLDRLNKPEVSAVIHDKASRINVERVIRTEDDIEGSSFRRWVDNFSTVASLGSNATADKLKLHIKWASQAKWAFSEQIETLFCPGGQDLPSWINNIYKLGRYWVAAKVMVKLAVKQPSLFTSMHVSIIETPPSQSFTPGGNKKALSDVLQRLTEQDDTQDLIAQLGKVWLTDDPESRFRKACHLTLTVHAEMQLLSFYDDHPELTPRFLFMGTSKKACFLCHQLMSRHPLDIGVSACHQKLYPSWQPAECTQSKARKSHKVLLWELSRYLEQIVARDLRTRLGVQRPRTLDSTAGPSFPTTSSLPSTW